MEKKTYITFTQLAEILHAKTDYEEILSKSSLSIPKNRKSLTPENAKWFLENAKKYNKRTVSLTRLEEVCNSFLSYA